MMLLRSALLFMVGLLSPQSVQSEQRVQRVNLHLALGGGFGETARFSLANPDAKR